MGLRELKQFADEKGEPLVLKRDETKRKNALPGVGRPWQMDTIDRIPKEIRDEVAGIIINGGDLTEEETKNS